MDKPAAIEQIKKGAVQIYSEDSLTQRLQSGKRLTVKWGADPSRPDLHLGHSVILRQLKLFQELGHRVVFVVGDFTGMIGDPTGKSKTRPALTMEETRVNGETYFKQVAKILDVEKIEIAYNSQWLAGMNFADVIKLCSMYTLARLLERDDFKNRFTHQQPISVHELLYPLVQGYDSVALKADVEVGGTDQTFNLLVGRTLQADYGQTSQEVITYPLLAGLDGSKKMSKSLDNYIGVAESAEAMFEKAMRIPDHLLADYFILTTDTPKVEAEKLIAKDIREAHFAYASMIVGMYHNKASARSAKERYLRVAGGGAPSEMAVLTVEESKLPLTDLLRRAGFAASNSEGRRAIAGKGVKINGVLAENPTLEMDINGEFVLQFGKNKFVKVKRGAKD